MGDSIHQPLHKRLRSLLAPLVRRVIPSRLPMKGPYGGYLLAMAETIGYDSPLVTQQVEEATRAVIEGRAIYERDGTAFAARPSLPIHTALGSLLAPSSTIADFGGGLGGLYINAPELFPPGCRCLVIEQHSMVVAGRRLASAHALAIEFFEADDLSAIPPVDVLVLSSVLQYLPDPWPLLNALLHQLRPRSVIVDRTAVRRGDSRWFVQTNPGYYEHPVTYPIQVLDCDRLRRSFPGYQLKREWRNSFDAQRPEHIGLLFVRDGESP